MGYFRKRLAATTLAEINEKTIAFRKKNDMLDKALEYRNNANRVESERRFSHLKVPFWASVASYKISRYYAYSDWLDHHIEESVDFYDGFFALIFRYDGNFRKVYLIPAN